MQFKVGMWVKAPSFDTAGPSSIFSVNAGTLTDHTIKFMLERSGTSDVKVYLVVQGVDINEDFDGSSIVDTQAYVVTNGRCKDYWCHLSVALHNTDLKFAIAGIMVKKQTALVYGIDITEGLMVIGTIFVGLPFIGNEDLVSSRPCELFVKDVVVYDNAKTQNMPLTKMLLGDFYYDTKARIALPLDEPFDNDYYSYHLEPSSNKSS